MKTTKQITGGRGEDLARAYLEQKGYRFITANWKCKAGEIDLIMQKDRALVFVEVRTRRPTSYGAGYETVGWQKQQKLSRAGRWYMQSVRWRGDARFDVVSITDDGSGVPEVEHIEYAFDA